MAAALLAPVAGRAAKLPDNRAYELVSPIEKNGNEAGFDSFSLNGSAHYGIVTADGKGVLYSGTGPIGAATGGFQQYTVARQTAAGWVNAAPLPPGLGQLTITSRLGTIYPSSDLGRLAFIAQNSYVPADPDTNAGASIYRAGTNEPLVWIADPISSEAFSPTPQLSAQIETDDLGIAGAAPDLSTIYFVYDGTLIPADAGRVAHIPAADGFYEWHNGVLTSASVLPDGSLDPFGAVPASLGKTWALATPSDFNNEVSVDGSRAFFVSPSPTSGSGRSPELYVREPLPGGGKQTILISRSQVSGEAAPDGPSIVDEPDYSTERESYVYASPDGSQAYFASIDQLTADAPNDASSKEYVFDLEDNVLTYLPGVVGPILGSTEDGSRFLFEDSLTGELDLCIREASGPRGCSVTAVAPLPAPPATSTNSGGHTIITATRAASDGSAFVFQTDSPLPGGFNNAGGYTQVYRYEVGIRKLTCISCPPMGEAPSGDANLSNDDSAEDRGILIDARGISSDADEVFFDTPDALVQQDVNGVRDVYEWNDGQLSLISAGTGPQDSFFIDNSASGEDVFFATTDSLASADVDGGYDVYDAQVGGGVVPVQAPTACTGEGCQSALSATPAFAVAGSIDATPEENLPPPVVHPAKPKTKPKAKKPKAKHKVKKTKKKHKLAQKHKSPPKTKQLKGRAKQVKGHAKSKAAHRARS